MNNRREILVRHSVQAAMARDFGVGRKAVREALAGLTRSKLADELRAAAVERYGGVMVPGDSREVATPP